MTRSGLSHWQLDVSPSRPPACWRKRSARRRHSRVNTCSPAGASSSPSILVCSACTMGCSCGDVYVTQDGKTGHVIRMDEGTMAVRSFEK